MLNIIPTDTLYHISTFLNFKEIVNVVQTHRIPKCLDKHRKKKQMAWLQKKIYNNLTRRFHRGRCADNNCHKQRAICIDIVALKTHVLSQYCGHHTFLYKYIDAITLI